MLIAAVVLGELQELPVLLKSLCSEHAIWILCSCFVGTCISHGHLCAEANFRYQFPGAQREQVRDHLPRGLCHGDQDVVDLTNLWWQCRHLWRCFVWPGSQ